MRRTAVTPFPAGQLVTLERVESGASPVPLLPPDAALPQLRAVTLERERAVRLRQGQAVPAGELADPQAALVRLYGPSGHFMGIGAVEPGGEWLKPVRLFNDSCVNQLEGGRAPE